ncbi:MAG TPA: hypothetical protein DEQ47_13255 [Solibacterales bacterium]|nr:hypothetical protein [Bryobacterales bacterium]
MARRWRVAAVAVMAAALLLVSHAALLTLPFYWDEVGQFVPASLDLFHSGALVPYSTVPNVHPPGVMAYLAGVWRVFGYSIVATRVAMLCLAAAGVTLTYLITRKLAPSDSTDEIPAVAAAGLLALSPLFFSQAMMAQLDMPAMVCFALAFWLFLEDRIAACAVVCAVLVLVKETGIVAPMLFGAWMLKERRWRAALWFVLPLPGLAAWLLLLRHATGHLFGNAEFTDYNVFYPLHPVRLVLALVRRCYYAFVANGHVIGLLALVLTRRLPLWRTRGWRVAWIFVGLHVVLISVLGGAVLERYLLPVYPIVYAAFALAIWRLGQLRVIAFGVFAVLLVAGIFVNPPFPFPLENNLAWTSFVKLEQQAAAFVEQRYPAETIATSFPLASALRRPEYGFVRHGMRLYEISDFQADNVAALRGKAGVLVLYSALWDPLGLMSNARWTGFLSRYYGYAPQASPADVERLLGARLVAQWSDGGQEMWCFQLR